MLEMMAKMGQDDKIEERRREERREERQTELLAQLKEA